MAAPMGKLKWYKRDPTRALKGMMELTLEQRGAYNTVLDLIYAHDNELRDDDRFIAGWLRVDVRVWRRLRTTLISCGKLYVRDGLIHNEKADVEVLEALHRVASAADAGIQSGRSRASKSDHEFSETNDLEGTAVPTDRERPFEQPTSTTTLGTKKSFSNASGLGGKKNGETTIKDPAERLARFQKSLAESFAQDGWSIVTTASNPDDPQFERALAICKKQAQTLGKGWPHAWPEKSGGTGP